MPPSEADQPIAEPEDCRQPIQKMTTNIDQPIADPQRCRHQKLINQYQIQKTAANLYQMTANIDRPMANPEICRQTDQPIRSMRLPPNPSR